MPLKVEKTKALKVEKYYFNIFNIYESLEIDLFYFLSRQKNSDKFCQIFSNFGKLFLS